jgi:hypothetical protein
MRLAATLWLGATCTLASAAAASIPDDPHTGFRLLQFGGHYVKWGKQTLGTGATVTYAFVDTGMQFDNARNCNSIVPITVATHVSGIPLDDWKREAAKAFRIWEDAADITFVAIEDPARADILIGAQGRPLGRAYANVTYLPDSASNGVKVLDQALICFNPFHGWKVGFDGDTSVYDIRYTFVHEIGHAIGLNHPSPSGQIMSFRYSEHHVSLQPGDLRGVTRLYGEPREQMTAGTSPAMNGPETSGNARKTVEPRRRESVSPAFRHVGYVQP